MKLKLLSLNEVDVKYLIVYVTPRAWEDSKVNGKSDDNDKPSMPCISDGRWLLCIDIDTGEIDGWPSGTIASIHYEVEDGGYTIADTYGELLMNMRDCYVPSLLNIPIKDEYSGHSIVMEIDGNGQIKDWKADLTCFKEYNYNLYLS
jgi:hypothetical protein